MMAIPDWVYLCALALAVAAAFGPGLVRMLQESATTAASKPKRFHVPPAAPAEPDATPEAPMVNRTFLRAAWINDLCALTARADAEGQTEVATASRALIAALVAVKEKTP